MSGAKLKAVLFDVDGTLIDSNELHVQAWREALEHFGVPATAEQLRHEIGKGGDQLIPVFVHPPELERLQPEIERFRGELYARDYLPRIKPFPGVRALFERLRNDGVRRVLASSGKAREVEHAMEVAGIADLVDAKTTADDVERSKPSPDIFRAALEKAEALPEQAIVVGDTPYDAQSAAGAGLRTIGLLSGGFPEVELRQAGCVAVYPSIQGLLDDHRGSLLAPE